MSDLDNLLKQNDEQSELNKTVKEFFKSEGETDIRTKTILSMKDNPVVQKIIRAIYYARECERFESFEYLPKITDIVHKVILDNLYTLNISVKGKGREQFFEYANKQTNADEKSGLAKFLGLKK